MLFQQNEEPRIYIIGLCKMYVLFMYFIRHFYPKGLTVHLGHTFLSVCDYINVYKKLYTTTNKIKLWLIRII